MQRPPATFEEFLEFQHLKDWPEDPFVEEPLAVACTPDVKYSLHLINEELTGNAPFNNKIYAEVDEKVSQIASLLDKCTSQICLPCSDKCLPSTTETFLNEAGVSDLEGRIQSKSKEPTDVTPKGYHVETFIFPGFKSTHVTQLPRNLDSVHLLNCSSSKQNFKGSKSHLFKKLYLSNASIAILQDSFWWFFLQKFKPDHEQQGKLFNRISDNYAYLFCSAPQNAKDFFFMIYPDCLSQSIYVAFYEAFPESLALFNNEFKSEIIDLLFQWMCGIKPKPYLWTNWNLSCFGENSPSSSETIRKKYMHISQRSLMPDGRKQLDFNLDELIREARDTSLLAMSEGKDMSVTESHSIGPGPEFHQVLFNLGGHCPLILHYLKRHTFSTFVPGGTNHKMKRTEILKLPPPVGPTYQDVIKETQKHRKIVLQDYSMLEAKTQKELLEIQQQKQRISLQIDKMKEEISNGVKYNSTRLLEKLQRTSFTSNIFKREPLTIKEFLTADSD